MTQSRRKWNAAVKEHEAVVSEFLAVCERCAQNDWQRAPGPNKWSTAAVALHICSTYELGRDAIRGGQGMRAMVSKPYAWLLRTAILPLIFATKRFPSAKAPREVRPDADEAQRLTPEQAATRLRRGADEAVLAFREASGRSPPPRMDHAYFGSLTPYTAFRLLTAHTRHHTRLLARDI